ncbi:hypothetical protein CZ771_03530 [Actinomycetales bacterium JB111]|nr:hypothetical protein CZ771_03530 [Actinomycetales bacterium JB111]
MLDYVIALVPPIGLALLLAVVVRAFLRADRTERDAERRFREEHPDLDLAATSIDRRPAFPVARDETTKGNVGGTATDDDPQQTR